MSFLRQFFKPSKNQITEHFSRASLAAHAQFVDRLAKLSQFSASSGMVDLANGLQVLIQAEKDFAKRYYNKPCSANFHSFKNYETRKHKF